MLLRLCKFLDDLTGVVPPDYGASPPAGSFLYLWYSLLLFSLLAHRLLSSIFRGRRRGMAELNSRSRSLWFWISSSSRPAEDECPSALADAWPTTPLMPRSFFTSELGDIWLFLCEWCDILLLLTLKDLSLITDWGPLPYCVSLVCPPSVVALWSYYTPPEKKGLWITNESISIVNKIFLRRYN